MTVEKRKWGGRVTSRWIADVSAAGEHRLVWRTPAGTALERPGRSNRTFGSAQRSATDGGWWVATLLGEGPARRWKIDAAAPAALTDSTLSFIDLDLDLRMGPGRRLAVHDVGQFVARAIRDRYPPRVIVYATGGLVAALWRALLGRWPFDGSLDPPS